MSEAASTAGGAEDESSQQTAPDRAEHLTCNRCGAALDRDHVHGSKNRSQTSYRCPECRYGAAAVVERGSGDIGPLHGRRITRDQRRLEQNPSVEVLAAFVDEHVPEGTYTIERTGDHAYRISAPTHVEESTIQKIASRLESPSTAVARASDAITVIDTRFVEPAENSAWDRCGQESQGPQPDGGIRLQAAERQQGPVPAAQRTVAGIEYAPNEARTERALS